MHRTFSVPCRIGWWSLLVSVTLHIGIHAASAQNINQPPNDPVSRPDDPQRPAIMLAVGSSQPCGMTTRADLKRVENPNSNVVRVGRVPDKNNEILLTAAAPGRTTVTLTDHQGRVEVHEVVVVTAEVPQEPKALVRIRLDKGDQRTIKLDQIPLGGSRTTRGGVVDLIPAKNDPKSYTVIGIGAGTTRVLFYTDKAQQDYVEYEFEVAPEDPIGQLKAFISTIPTAGVTATLIKLPARDSKDNTLNKFENGVVLRGTVTNSHDAAAIVAVAKRLFPPSIIGQQGVSQSATPAGPTTTAIGDLLRENVVNYIQIGGVQQVDLHVVVAVVNRTRAKALSFSWVANGNEWFAGSLFGGPLTSFSNGVATGVFNSLTASTGSTSTANGTFNIPFGVIHNNNNFFSYLQLLNSEGVTKILARPRVTTLSGRPAYIVSGGETPILTTSTGGSSVTYKQFGTVVNCLPTVMGNGKILLEVKPELSQIDNSAGAGISISGISPASAPGFTTRSAQVTVQLEDGQTLAIGGLIQNKFSNLVQKVPVLGDIPGLQFFFTNKNQTEEEEEMVILVTPRLVDPIDCAKFPKYMPGEETRPPDDFEFFLEGIMEAPRHPRAVVFHPRLYQAAYKNAPNVGQIPCADGSCSSGGIAAGCATGNCGGAAAVPFAAPKAVSAPTVPSVPATTTSNTNKIVVEPEVPMLSPPVREILPSTGPSVPSLPPIPPAPPRELQSRPVLPPLSPPNVGPN